MVDKKLFDEITDWSRIDYICIKSKMRSLDTSVYYLDGHPMFEKTLSGSDMEFMDFVREIKGYGTSEKMIDSKTTMDRFYVRVNLENDQQERELIDYLKKKVKTSEEQMEFLDYLRGIDNVIKMIVNLYITVDFPRKIHRQSLMKSDFILRHLEWMRVFTMMKKSAVI